MKISVKNKKRIKNFLKIIGIGIISIAVVMFMGIYYFSYQVDNVANESPEEVYFWNIARYITTSIMIIFAFVVAIFLIFIEKDSAKVRLQNQKMEEN